MARAEARAILESIRRMKGQMRRLGVKRLGLFGSYAIGKHSERSDLDFLVEFERPTFDNYMDLKELLQKTFGRNVDLVTDESLKPLLRHIKEEALYAEIS